MDYDNEFSKYVYWLGDAIPTDMKNEAKKFFLNCKNEYIPYIICPANPFTWNEAIQILREIGYPKNKEAAQNIMYLFQDINWLFTETALVVIREIYLHEPERVVAAMEAAIKIAGYNHDEQWLFGLSCVKENLGISKIDFQEKESMYILFKGGYWDNMEDIT